MPADMRALLTDLRAETRAVRDLLAPLDDAGWETATPSAGWAIRDQVSHLAYFDEAAALAATDPERFRAEAADLMQAGPGFPDQIARRYRSLPPATLLAWFDGARERFLTMLAPIDPAARQPWYGPDMSAASAVTARLMETWAHGQDVADALGAPREPTGRLRHVAYLGVRTFGFCFRLHGRPVPDAPVRVELAAPDGTAWAWGPAGARDRVTGPALDFCLVVTQRRHVADTALEVHGPVAAAWIAIAQAFAGAPGGGRAPGQFAAAPGPGGRPCPLPAAAPSPARSPAPGG
jgi:uncharacterized protein (TIGR03084 family)